VAGENQGQNPAGNRKMMFLDAEPEISTRPAGSRTHRYQSSGLGKLGARRRSLPPHSIQYVQYWRAMLYGQCYTAAPMRVIHGSAV